jgi:hypothetical protein
MEVDPVVVVVLVLVRRDWQLRGKGQVHIADGRCTIVF